MDLNAFFVVVYRSLSDCQQGVLSCLESERKDYATIIILLPFLASILPVLLASVTG
jgi:hypothetical protein